MKTTIQKQHEDHETISSNIIIQNENNNNNNYNISHGAGRVPPTPRQMDAIKDAYLDNIGPLTQAVALMIERAMDRGLTPDEILMAIEETGFAPRPTPWYLRAILENWAENGVTVSKARHLVKPNEGTKWWK